MQFKKVALGLVLICVASLLLYPAITVQAFEETGINSSALATEETEINSSTLATEETGVPIGTIIAFAGAVAPKGYLLCDGTSYSRINYENLYAVIGTIYGSLDGATFKVPDLRGEFIRGLDYGRGVDTGRALGTQQGCMVQSHNHAIPGTHMGNGSQGVTGPTGQSGDWFRIYNTTDYSGGSETRPRNVAVNYCIKY